MGTKVTIKRKTSNGFDELIPRTTIDAVENLSTELSKRVHWDDDVGEPNGVAPLNSSAQIDIGYLPSEAITGMYFKDTIGSDDDWPDGPWNEEDIGNYWIFTSDVEITIPSDGYFKNEKGELKDSGEDVKFQAGDWLILINPDENGFSLINNNQSDRFLSKGGGTLTGNLSLDGQNISNVGNISANYINVYGGKTIYGPSFSVYELDGYGGVIDSSGTSLEILAKTIEFNDTKLEKVADGTEDDHAATVGQVNDKVANRVISKKQSDEPDNLNEGDIWFET